MSQQDDSGSGTLRYFGAQMKLLRGRASLSRGELGERVGYSESTIASFEQGRRLPTRELVEQFDEILGAGGLLMAGAKFLLQARYPRWFVDFALLEADVVSLCSYESLVVPGLIQTEEYARAVISARCPPLDDEEIENRVAARLERQQLLSRKPSPVLGFVIEEVVLRRPIGGKKTMRAQLARVRQCAEMRNVTLQVMPTHREAHTGLDGPLVLMETAEGKNLVYVEGQSGSILVSEPKQVGTLTQRYGVIRAQALSPEDSVNLIDQAAGEL